jgi:peptide/nickel transport system permease protein
MQRYLARRLVMLLPVLIGTTVIVFSFIHLIPGDAALVILGNDYTPEGARQLRNQLGLDRPVYVQYLIWMGNVLQGDLGNSIYPFGGVKFKGDPVVKLIFERLPTTVALTFGTMTLSILLALPIGMITAIKRNSTTDSILRIVSMIGISIPVFWFGLLLILVFSIWLHWLPANGNMNTSGLQAIILPIIALGVSDAALLSRMTRSAMLEVLAEDYVRMARAKGLKDLVVYYRHALRNALIPIVTVVGFQFGGLLSGAILTETIFTMPGLGRLLVESVFRRDYPVIQGCALVIALMFVLTNLVVDLLYAYLDPRVSLTS